MAKEPRPLDDLLRRVLPNSPLAEGLERQRALEIYDEVVGADIARHSTAVALQDGVLLVRVDGSVWAQELSLLRETIKAAFAERLGAGAVRDIRFHSGQGPMPPTTER